LTKIFYDKDCVKNKIQIYGSIAELISERPAEKNYRKGRRGMLPLPAAERIGGAR
jgi:hypothetical protein